MKAIRQVEKMQWKMWHMNVLVTETNDYISVTRPSVTNIARAFANNVISQSLHGLSHQVLLADMKYTKHTAHACSENHQMTFSSYGVSGI